MKYQGLVKIQFNIAGHIGSNDAELSSQHLNVIQSQMQSKGGYDINSIRIQVRHQDYPIHHAPINLKKGL